MDYSRMEDCINKLRPEMFMTPFYSDIYRIFEDGFNENQEVDIVYIQSELLNSKKYEERAINENLAFISSSLDVSVLHKNCIDIIINDYKVNCYNSKIKVPIPKNSTVNDAVKQMISELESIIEDDDCGVVSVSDMVLAHKEEYFKSTVEKKKVYFGLRELDKMVGGVEGGDIVILAARPAVGKSALALQIIEYNANKGKRVGYFNLEMKEKQVYERLAAKASGIEIARIRNATRFLQDEESKFNTGNDKLSKWNNVFVKSGSETLSDLRIAVKNGHYDLVIVDYLQLLKPNKSRGANRYAEVGDISRGVKAIAMDFDVPIIALAQLNRASEGREDREPTMAEIRESGDIEADASVIILMWNSNKDDKTKKKIKVEKARMGKLGTEELIFSGATMTFNSAGKVDEEEFVQLDEDDDTPFT